MTKPYCPGTVHREEDPDASSRVVPSIACAPSIVSSTSTLNGFEGLVQRIAQWNVDRSPWDEQAWLWAPAQDVPFKTIALPADPPPELDLQPYVGFVHDVIAAVNDWVREPLVWRATPDGQGVQAVLLGAYRFSWSIAATTGRWERWDAWAGWRPYADELIAFEWLDLFLNDANGTSSNENVSFVPLIEQIARHAQRTAPRAQWSHQDGVTFNAWENKLRWSWMPMCAYGPDMQLDRLQNEASSTGAVDPSLLRLDPSLPQNLNLLAHHGVPTLEQALTMQRGLRRSLHALGAHLARLDPLWRTLARTMVRGPASNSCVKLLGTLVNAVLPSWSAWSHAVQEHPRAHLLLEEAVNQTITPGLHTWRPEFWCSATTPSQHVHRTTFKRLRESPLSMVKTLVRHASVAPGMADQLLLSYAVLDLMAVCQTGPLPNAALRTVPVDLWNAALKDLNESSSVREAFKGFSLRALTAFFNAVKARPWVDQRLSLPVWLLHAQPVLEWAGDLGMMNVQQKNVPVMDPSWTWKTLVDRWMVEHRGPGAWPAPFEPFVHEGTVLTPIVTEAAWRLLGSVMGNCLKDDRSDCFLEDTCDARAVLVRLSDRTTSAVLLQWEPSWKDGRGAWSVGQHYASHNQVAPAHHRALTHRLRKVMDLAHEHTPLPQHRHDHAPAKSRRERLIQSLPAVEPSLSDLTHAPHALAAFDVQLVEAWNEDWDSWWVQTVKAEGQRGPENAAQDDLLLLHDPVGLAPEDDPQGLNNVDAKVRKVRRRSSHKVFLIDALMVQGVVFIGQTMVAAVTAVSSTIVSFLWIQVMALMLTGLAHGPSVVRKFFKSRRLPSSGLNPQESPGKIAQALQRLRFTVLPEDERP